MTVLPTGLLDAIRAGNCVAFVGAGFSQAAGLPSWKALLGSLARHGAVSPDLRHHVAAVAASDAATAHDLDQAAQMLVDEVGHERLADLLRTALVTDDLPPTMVRRLSRLQSVPFKAILTTNFDGILRNTDPNPREAYRRVLRGRRAKWWEATFWDDRHPGAPTLKLHGDLLAPPGDAALVFTREDYRRKLYEGSSYMTFLRSTLSTSTVLYLGFSFTDAYLNELRSEILAMLGTDALETPIAYAVIANATPATCRHLKRHEGIEVLPYDASVPEGHAGFDVLLDAIHARTSPQARLGEVLNGRRILWMDPNPRNNEFGVQVLVKAAESCTRQLHPIVRVDTPAAAAEALRTAVADGRPFDLLIAHWGRGTGREILTTLRREDLRVPAIVFAGPLEVETRKREALALGALAYCYVFDSLFQRIEDAFSREAAGA